MQSVQDTFPLELLRGQLQAMQYAGYSLETLQPLGLPAEVYQPEMIDASRSLSILAAGRVLFQCKAIMNDESYGFFAKDSLSLGHTQLLWLSSVHSKNLGGVLREQYELSSDLGSNFGFLMDIMEASGFYGFRREGCDYDIPQGLLQRSDLGHLYWWYRVACWFVGELFPLESVSVMGDDDNTRAIAEALFQCPVNYQQDCYSVEFSNELLELPVAKTKRDITLLQDDFGAACLDVKLKSSRNFAELLEAMLEIDNNLQMDNAAARMHCSRHTLNRRLKAQDTSFQQLKDQCRMKRAKNLLLDDEYSIEDISGMLGFSNPPAFTRAFRNWFDVSPSRFRGESMSR